MSSGLMSLLTEKELLDKLLCYLDEKQYESIYADTDELVRILVARCMKLDSESEKE